jgi:RNA polymerase sigma-70 factor (ECF subfamily)
MANQAEKTHMTAFTMPYENVHILAAGAQKDRLTSFNDLILQYQDAAFNFAFYILGDSDTAEDVLQQAIINAYLHFDSFRGVQFRSWLFKIVKNACYDELRRQKRHRTYSLESMEGESNHEPEWNHLTARPLSPEQVVERHESAQQIQAALGRMEETFRTVLVLIDIQEMDYQEVAQILGAPLGTVKSRLARARRQFRAILEQ